MENPKAIVRDYFISLLIILCACPCLSHHVTRTTISTIGLVNSQVFTCVASSRALKWHYKPSRVVRSMKLSLTSIQTYIQCLFFNWNSSQTKRKVHLSTSTILRETREPLIFNSFFPIWWRWLIAVFDLRFLTCNSLVAKYHGHRIIFSSMSLKHSFEVELKVTIMWKWRQNNDRINSLIFWNDEKFVKLWFWNLICYFECFAIIHTYFIFDIYKYLLVEKKVVLWPKILWFLLKG